MMFTRKQCLNFRGCFLSILHLKKSHLLRNLGKKTMNIPVMFIKH